MTMPIESGETKTPERRRVSPMFEVVRKCIDMLYEEKYELFEEDWEVDEDGIERAVIDVGFILSLREELCAWYVSYVPTEAFNSIGEFEKYRRWAPLAERGKPFPLAHTSGGKNTET
jgi:hypothetical protein